MLLDEQNYSLNT